MSEKICGREKAHPYGKCKDEPSGKESKIRHEGPPPPARAASAASAISDRSLSLPVDHFTSTFMRIQGWIQHSK